jgi:hypothetical protein
VVSWSRRGVWLGSEEGAGLLRTRSGVRFVDRLDQVLRLEGDQVEGTVSVWEGSAWRLTQERPIDVELDSDSNRYLYPAELARWGIPPSSRL